MLDKPPHTLDFPPLPLGSAGGTQIFARAAEQIAAASQAEASASPPHAVEMHCLDRDPPSGQSKLHDLLRKARGAPVPLGRYDVLRTIGAGAMGVVYEAIDREHRLRVALKTLQHLDGPSLYRFKNEFRSAQSVVHPNLCALYELVSLEDEWFFTMELVEGVTFTEHVRGPAGAERAEARPPPGFDEARLRAALAQLAEGVSALHEAGMLHRDLNASNVLVTREGRVVILDFGLITADPGAGHEAPGFDVLCGTPAYMAPEQCTRLPATTASDWYAVGVMLYEALTGQLPFMGGISSLIHDRRTRDPVPPGALSAGVPADLDALCLALLRRAPADRPSGPEVLRRLGATAIDLGARAIDALSSPTAAFVGRQGELRALAGALADVSPGRPVSVHVHGPSGMGKSALVRRFLAGLREGGRTVVLEGRCHERESVPYKALDSLIDALTRHLRSLPAEQAAALLPEDIHALAQVFPVLGGVPAVRRVPPRRFEVRDPQQVRWRALDALKELLRKLASAGPLVLHIDDLQWGDLDSARMLTELLSPPDPPGLLLITTYRSDAMRESPWLVALRRARSREPWRRPVTTAERADAAIPVRDIPVEALSREHAIELALCRMQREGAERQAIALAIAIESDGSPFLVEELARDAERVRPGPGGGAPISLEQLVQARLDRLGPDARRLLELIAVAARPLELGLLIAAADMGHRVAAALVQLRTSRLIRAEGMLDTDCVEIYHDRMREAVMARLRPEVLRDHHRRLAQALEAQGARGGEAATHVERARDPERLSRHFLAAGMLEQAAIYAEAAARQAEAALAFERAADLYRDALVLRPHDPASDRALRLKRAFALVNAGRCAEAAPIFLACASGAPPDEALDLRRRAAEQLLLAGHVREGLRVLRPVLAALGLRYPRTRTGAFLTVATQLARLRLRGTRFRARSERQIDPQIRARISTCWSAGRGLKSLDPGRSRVYLVETLLLALDAGDVEHIVPGLTVVGCMYIVEGTTRAVARGTKMLEEAADLTARTGDPRLVALTDNAAAIAHLYAGEWRKAFERFERGSSLLRDRCAGTTWERKLGQAQGIRALLALGELERRTRYAQTWLREANATGDLEGATSSALCVALNNLVRGDPEGTRADVRAAMERWSLKGLSRHHQTAWTLEVACDLYEDRPRDAFARVEDTFPVLERAHLFRDQLARIEGLIVRAVSALALSAKAPQQRQRLLRIAGADAARLAREERPHANAVAAQIQAGIAWYKGRAALAEAGLRAAAALYEAADMKLHAACARRHLAALTGDTGGIAAADAALRAQGIVDPVRWARMYTGLAF